MNSIVRALAVYLFVMLIFRLSGKRTLAQITTFDLVLTLIISEAVQQALIDTDESVTNAFLLVLTLIAVDILLSVAKQRSKLAEKLIDGVPLVVYDDGEAKTDRMDRERIDEDDVLSAGRELHGLSRIEDVRYAVIERSGAISVVPRQGRRRP